jgi:hypothetical protein
LKVWNEFSKTHPSDRGDSIVKQPWVICGEGVDEARIAEVEDAGVVVIPVELDKDGKLRPFHTEGQADDQEGSHPRRHLTSCRNWAFGQS